MLFLTLVCAAWAIPLWLVRFPPMLDYPQQLAAAAIIRWFHDPARNFQQAYALSLARPQGGFETITAALAWLIPFESAGKLMVSLSLAAVVPATVALCRRTGRPDWYALLALAVTYNHAFYWGFVDNLLAYPLVLGGVALADRLFDRPFGVSSWLKIALCGLLFHPVHLEFLLIFAGAVGWLALVRRPGWRRLVLWLSSLLPGLALGEGALAWAHFHPEVAMTGFQRRLQSGPTLFLIFGERLRRIPSLLFGAGTDGMQNLLLALLALVIIVLLLARRGAATDPDADRDAGRGALFRSRFATLSGWIWLLYLVLPVYTRGYLVSERLVPLAAMLAVPALPCPPVARRRLAALLAGVLLLVHLTTTTTAFLRFAAETAGLGELLAGTEPGQALAGLIFEPVVQEWETPGVLTHFPAYYQVLKGGRVEFSFAQFFNSPVRYRAGQNWEDAMLAEWEPAHPERFFYPRHAGPFRYFLVRGSRWDLAAAFGPFLPGLRVRAAGRWFLVERVPSVPRKTGPP